MKSPVVKRSIVIAGHKTSVSLEDAFWKGLKEIATGRGLTLSEMVGTSIRHGRKATCRRPFASSFSTTIVPRSPAEDGTNLPKPDVLQVGSNS